MYIHNEGDMQTLQKTQGVGSLKTKIVPRVCNCRRQIQGFTGSKKL